MTWQASSKGTFCRQPWIMHLAEQAGTLLIRESSGTIWLHSPLASGSGLSSFRSQGTGIYFIFFNFVMNRPAADAQQLGGLLLNTAGLS